MRNGYRGIYCNLKPRVPAGYSENKKRIVILVTVLYKLFEYANTYKR